MKKRQSDQSDTPASAKLSTVILYESSVARERALQSWHDFERSHDERLDVDWFSFAQLNQAGPAREAARKATVADIVVFATSEEGELPGEIKMWMEGWLCKRHAREGTLVGLVERKHGIAPTAGLKEIYFRHAAHRAGMDYLSQTPRAAAQRLPDSLDSVRERAGTMTSVLDRILQTPALPPRF